jgi:signal transduction histidine kinase/ActR/RegA family two-component response regulator
VIGASLRETALPHLFDRFFETYARVLRTGTTEQMPDIELTDRNTGRPFVLASHVSRVGERVAQVSRDVTLERTAEREITAAQAQAEHANRAKTEFLSRMSHELRTPLNAILGFSQLLEMDDLNDDQRENVGYIRKGGQHLLELINEVLDISRIESGQMTISSEPVGLVEVLDDAIALVRPLAATRSITIRGAHAPCATHVMADRQRLKQILLNLLSNAIKYNRDGGSVQVRCARAGSGRLRIDVTDTGYGIAPELLGRLFRPFDRLGAEWSSVEGTGMGLTLSKGLAEAMGGSISVESRLDVGTTFSIELALAEGPVERLERLSPAPDDKVTTHLSQKVLLQIEDNVSNQRLVERVLARRPGVRLMTAMQGGLGIDLARQHRPSMVLLDLHLPDMAGLEVLRRLRSYPETRDIPVVVLSADATKSQITLLLEAGAAGYLTKPLDVGVFLQHVDRAIGSNDATAR